MRKMPNVDTHKSNQRRGSSIANAALAPIQTNLPPPFLLRVALQNIIVLVLWAWLYSPTYALLSTVMLREDFRTNQVILVGIVLLVVHRLRQEQVRLRIDQPMHWYSPALLLTLGSSIAYLLSERFLNINILAACLFGLGSYGLLGLWLSPQHWREGLPVALLLVGALPFGDHIQTFFGYPMRVWTAELVRQGLASGGVASLGVDTILVFENSVAQVDVPCSGVKSLWTGGLFLLAATWIDRKPISWRWMGIVGVFVVVLFLTNLMRVALLIVTGPVLGWTLLAELIHVPLGLVMFILACGVALLLLRRIPAPVWPVPYEHGLRSPMTAPPRPWVRQTALSVILLVMNFAYTPHLRVEAQLSTATAHTMFLQLPDSLRATSVPTQPNELAWLVQDGAEAIERVRFDWRGLSGSMLIVRSTSWRAHHKPERCFENYGWQTQETHTQLLAAALPVRALRLAHGQTGGQLSALYWFQSAKPTAQTTDDYGIRLWSAVSLRPARWMLVTILFDQPYLTQADPQLQRDIAALAQEVQRAVQTHLAQLP